MQLIHNIYFNKEIFHFQLVVSIILLAISPDRSSKKSPSIFFSESITLPPLVFVDSIISFIVCIT
jgi:hypothetical protein